METLAETLTEALRSHRAGDFDRAEQLYRQIVEADPNHADAWCNLGDIYLRRGRLDEAVVSYRRAVEIRPDFSAAHNDLGVALTNQKKRDQAEACFRQAIQSRPDYAEAHTNLGGVLTQQGKLLQAIRCFQEAIRLRPNYADAHGNLGLVRFYLGQLPEAIACQQQALEISPQAAGASQHLQEAVAAQQQLNQELANYCMAHWNVADQALAFNELGLQLQTQSRWLEALASFQEAVRLRPEFAEAYNNLGLTFKERGNKDEAILCLRQALKVKPDFALVHNNLGIILDRAGELGESVASYHEALRLKPDFAEAHNNLGVVLGKQGKNAEAAAQYRQALQCNPGYSDAQNNLGLLLEDQGRVEEAEVHFREAIRLKPEDPGTHGCLLMCLNYIPHTSPASLLAEHRLWGDRHSVRTVPAHANSPDPQRRLRIGYVSPDFCWHPVAAFLEPILAHHDPRQVEVFCYAEVALPDDTTARLRSLAHGWRSTCGLADARVAEMIRADRIDILVDLAGHTGANRLLVFAHKPAPVQLTYLGYPSTSGLAAIDYRLTDTVADPPGEANCHTEELWRLPGCFCCFAAAANAPAVTPLPALRAGHVTFGSLHKPSKLNGQVLDLWCRVLHAVPSARLLICRHSLGGETRQRFRGELERRGIPAERVELRQGKKSTTVDHLAVYAEIDVLLDTFPWGGHTTACESLWMGVPLLTLSGDRHSSRMVSSVLHCLNLDEWVAQTPEEYIERGVRLTADLSRLAELRRTLRDTMHASPLCDGLAFTRRLEEAYRTMWRRWCAGKRQ